MKKYTFQLIYLATKHWSRKCQKYSLSSLAKVSLSRWERNAVRLAFSEYKIADVKVLHLGNQPLSASRVLYPTLPEDYFHTLSLSEEDIAKRIQYFWSTGGPDGYNLS